MLATKNYFNWLHFNKLGKLKTGIELGRQKVQIESGSG